MVLGIGDQFVAKVMNERGAAGQAEDVVVRAQPKNERSQHRCKNAHKQSCAAHGIGCQGKDRACRDQQCRRSCATRERGDHEVQSLSDACFDVSLIQPLSSHHPGHRNRG